ncbi:MAG: selenocysteine-specific translation elongation factor [FCB group bacterium]|nr:selenocysteine-specific translation elongation factor [FCB group bacterium]
MNQIVIGTAGHIDHGKTALVEALTGVNTDRLEEEQRRGMTIDLGFAFLNERLTIIDVPGHEKFIRNMVAGVATIHIGLLVVATDDGVMPQTREHVHILNLMGLHACLVALTKCDLIDDPDWLDLVEEDVRDLIKTTHLTVPEIIRTSTTTGEGIDRLRQALLTLADEIILPDPGPFFRLPIDRAFLKAGFGTIITGTVISGHCHIGDEVEIVPAAVKGKVRKIQSHQQDVDSVRAGDRAALNISGLTRQDVFRGAQATTPGWLTRAHRLLVDYTPLPETKLPKPKQRVRIHLGTDEILARITLVGPDSEHPETWRGVLEPERDIYTTLNDRFLLRTYSPMTTIGGGLILHPTPRGKWRQVKSAAQEIPREPERRLEWLVRERGDDLWTLKDWSRLFSVDPDTLLSYLPNTDCEYTEENFLFSRECMDRDQDRLKTILAAFHQRYPYRSRMNKENLKSEFQSNDRWFRYVLEALNQSQSIRLDDQGVALTDHVVTLSFDDQSRIEHLIRVFRAAELRPLDLAELTAALRQEETLVLELLHVLKGRGQALEIKPGIWLLTETIESMKQLLVKHFQDSNTLSVAQLKDLFGVTRKTGIPLLEYFDRRDWTRREGNERTAGESLNE